MTAWIGTQVVVPGIATEAECRRIGDMIVANGTTDSFKCVSYCTAHWPNTHDMYGNKCLDAK